MKKERKSPKMHQEKSMKNEIFEHAVVSKTDPDGSYTGVPRNCFETPIQDADDL